MKRAICLALAMTMGSVAMAGSLTLTSNTFAGLYNGNTWDTQVYNNVSNNYSGTAMAGSVSTASVTSLNADTAYASNTSSAAIFSEGSGQISVQDEFYYSANTDGASMYTENSGGTYTFTTGTPVDFVMYYLASYSSTPGLGGFGLWNPFLNLDGTTYQWAQFMSPPEAFNIYVVPLAAGTHTLNVQAWSNLGAYGTESESLNETVYFYTQAVPEPAPIAALGLGALGLLIRRRRR